MGDWWIFRRRVVIGVNAVCVSDATDLGQHYCWSEKARVAYGIFFITVLCPQFLDDFCSSGYFHCMGWKFSTSVFAKSVGIGYHGIVVFIISLIVIWFVPFTIAT